MAFLAYRTSKQGLKLQKKRETQSEKEKKKAALRAELEKHWESGMYYLYIRNRGHSSAREVKVALDGVAIEKHSIILKSGASDIKIGPESFVRWTLCLTMNDPMPKTVEIQWRDDSDEIGKYSTSLVF